MSRLPTPEEQLAFLGKVQRLFAEGDFTATYKFALLVSLADLAVESGANNGEPLHLSHEEIAEKFIELYWPQAAPYSRSGSGEPPMVLIQSIGCQATVITALSLFRSAYPALTLSTAKRAPEYRQLLRKVASTVAREPIQRIQNLGGEQVRFLFDVKSSGVELLPGVAYCLRQFQPLIQQLSRHYWIDHIKRNKRNSAVIGEDGDLESFLFERDRRSLEVLRSGLGKLNSGACFFCGRTVMKSPEADHFIPFSVYPRDLGHNFVYAHAECNRRKSDSLAALPHLDRWLNFTETHDEQLQEIAAVAGVSCDLKASRAVASWIYTHGCSAKSRAWVAGREFEPITQAYLDLLDSVA